MTTYHHGDLRAALVAAAGQILIDHGINGLSLRAAARQVGVSQTAPYRHFKAKDALLAAVAEDGFRQLLQIIRGAGAGQPDPIGRLTAESLAYVRFATANPELYRLMFGAEPARADHPVLASRAAETFDHLVDTVATGQRAGALRPGPPRQAARTAWAAVHGLCALLLDGQFGATTPSAVDRVTRRVTGDLLQGLSVQRMVDGAEGVCGSGDPKDGDGQRFR